MKLSYLTLAAAMMAAASGCSGDGSIEKDTFAVWLQSDGVCLGTVNSDEWTIGMGIRHDGDEPVTLEEITIVDPRNMSVLGTALLEPSFRLGTSAAWPPTDQDEYEVPTSWWDDRQPVAGSMMAPGDDRELNIGLKALSDEDAVTEGLVLSYSGPDGRQYEQRILAEINISGDCDALRQEQESNE